MPVSIRTVADRRLRADARYLWRTLWGASHGRAIRIQALGGAWPKPPNYGRI